MKVRIERSDDKWMAIVESKCRGVARSIRAVLHRLDRSIEAGVRHWGEDPALLTASRETEVFFYGPADDALARRNAAVAAYERAARELDIATGDAIRELKLLGIGNRDIGFLVGLSRSRVQQICSGDHVASDASEAANRVAR